ncbi:hypothetical protein DKE44_015890 [Acinetobacter nosocomialis]|nr:hypothetical protein DKE44_015890 [Acinetobacter nosocomialis]
MQQKLATEQTSFTNDSDFIQYYKDKSTAFFDNGSGKFFAQYAAGLVSSQMDGGTFIISTDILTGKAKLISCVVRANGTIDYLNKKNLLLQIQTYQEIPQVRPNLKILGKFLVLILMEPMMLQAT